jgi:G3E family GTPase
VIETTGLADPAPVVQTFFVDHQISAQVSLDGVVTVIDAKHIEGHWQAKEIQEQIVYADVILINKTDLVTSQQLDQLIKTLNPIAQYYRTYHAEIAVDRILGINAFNVDRALDLDPQFLQKHVHEHDKTVSAVSLSEAGVIDRDRLNHWLAELSVQQGEDIFRLKVFFNVKNESQRHLVQGVHHLIHQSSDRPWHPDESRRNELVFIGRNLDETQLRQSLRSCFVEPELT